MHMLFSCKKYCVCVYVLIWRVVVKRNWERFHSHIESLLMDSLNNQLAATLHTLYNYTAEQINRRKFRDQRATTLTSNLEKTIYLYIYIFIHKVHSNKDVLTTVTCSREVIRFTILPRLPMYKSVEGGCYSLTSQNKIVNPEMKCHIF